MKIRSILEILHDFENLRKFWPFLLKTLQFSQYLIKIFQIFCGSSLTHRKYFHKISLILEDMEIYAAVHFTILMAFFHQGPQGPTSSKMSWMCWMPTTVATSIFDFVLGVGERWWARKVKFSFGFCLKSAVVAVICESSNGHTYILPHSSSCV